CAKPLNRRLMKNFQINFQTWKGSILIASSCKRFVHSMVCFLCLWCKSFLWGRSLLKKCVG
ncbi:hypothetical protein, partial [uncultured Gammaproteobacteria bacterium]